MKQSFFTLLILLTVNQFVFSQSNISAYGACRDFRIDGPTGGYYYMLADSVRIRSQPNLDGEIIGMLPLHAKIRILPFPIEGLKSFQVIDGVAAYWYFIKFEDITGFIWGGYISANTLICDIDNNGIDDYFHYRISSIEPPHFYHLDAWTDVFIYINNIRIPTTDIVMHISVTSEHQLRNI